MGFRDEVRKQDEAPRLRALEDAQRRAEAASLVADITAVFLERRIRTLPIYSRFNDDSDTGQYHQWAEGWMLSGSVHHSSPAVGYEHHEPGYILTTAGHVHASHSVSIQSEPTAGHPEINRVPAIVTWILSPEWQGDENGHKAYVQESALHLLAAGDQLANFDIRR